MPCAIRCRRDARKARSARSQRHFEALRTPDCGNEVRPRRTKHPESAEFGHLSANGASGWDFSKFGKKERKKSNFAEKVSTRTAHRHAIAGGDATSRLGAKYPESGCSPECKRRFPGAESCLADNPVRRRASSRDRSCPALRVHQLRALLRPASESNGWDSGVTVQNTKD